MGNISSQDDTGDISDVLTSLVVLSSVVIFEELLDQSSEGNSVTSDVQTNSFSGLLGFSSAGSGEVTEELCHGGSNLRARVLDLVIVVVDGNNVGDQSNRVGLRGIQVSEGLVKISDEGNVSAVIDVSVVFNVEIIVETFNDLTELGGRVAEASVERPVLDGTVKTNSGGSESDEDGEEDNLVHLS